MVSVLPSLMLAPVAKQMLRDILVRNCRPLMNMTSMHSVTLRYLSLIAFGTLSIITSTCGTCLLAVLPCRFDTHGP